MPADQRSLEDEITLRASAILRRAASREATTTNMRRFTSMLGASPKVVALLWMIAGETTNASKLEHLLWALMFLKVYASEAVHAALAGVDEKTFRKWSWFWVKVISELDIVCLNRELH